MAEADEPEREARAGAAHDQCAAAELCSGHLDDAADIRRVEREVLAAVASFEAIRDEVSSLIDEVHRGETARAKKLSPAILDLARAVQTLARVGGQVDDEKRRAGSSLSEPALDLAAARDEVRRRLAGLRAAG